MSDACGVYTVHKDCNLRVRLKSAYRDEYYATLIVKEQAYNIVDVESEVSRNIVGERSDQTSTIAPGVLFRYWVQFEGTDIALIRIVSSLSGMYRIDIADTRDGFIFEVDSVDRYIGT